MVEYKTDISVHYCNHCTKPIRIIDKSEYKEALCDEEGKRWWCKDCFEYIDFSFLFDDNENIKDIKPVRCLYCNKFFKYNSKKRYKDQYSSEYFINNNKICSTECDKLLNQYLNNTRYYRSRNNIYN